LEPHLSSDRLDLPGACPEHLDVALDGHYKGGRRPRLSGTPAEGAPVDVGGVEQGGGRRHSEQDDGRQRVEAALRYGDPLAPVILGRAVHVSLA
jgi:hypothetical protein